MLVYWFGCESAIFDTWQDLAPSTARSVYEIEKIRPGRFITREASAQRIEWMPFASSICVNSIRFFQALQLSSIETAVKHGQLLSACARFGTIAIDKMTVGRRKKEEGNKALFSAESSSHRKHHHLKVLEFYPSVLSNICSTQILKNLVGPFPTVNA